MLNILIAEARLEAWQHLMQEALAVRASQVACRVAVGVEHEVVIVYQVLVALLGFEACFGARVCVACRKFNRRDE